MLTSHEVLRSQEAKHIHQASVQVGVVGCWNHGKAEVRISGSTGVLKLLEAQEYKVCETTGGSTHMNMELT